MNNPTNFEARADGNCSMFLVIEVALNDVEPTLVEKQFLYFANIHSPTTPLLYLMVEPILSSWQLVRNIPEILTHIVITSNI